jgi:L-alanine-DL-glutamate epimerase-like enolase superfamily enzyme
VHVIVRLETDEGLVGLGEMSDLDCYRMYLPDLAALKVAVLEAMTGFDPTHHADLHRRLQALMPPYLRSAAAYPPFSLGSQVAAALDMACYDLSAKRLGVPVCDLLGGRSRGRLEMAYPLFPARSAADVPTALDAVDGLVAEGIRRFRYYAGVDPDADEALLDGIRGRFRDGVELKGLDFQGRLYWKDAIRLYQRLRPYGIEMLESVSWAEDLAGMAEVRRRCDVAVSEHVSSYAQAMRLVRADAVDVLNVMHNSGGLWGASRLLALADMAGLKCLLGTTQELAIGTAAVAHLGASAAELHLPGDAVGPLLYLDDVVAGGVRYDGTALEVPEGPGLGVTIDEDALSAAAGSLIEWNRPAHAAGYVGQ